MTAAPGGFAPRTRAEAWARLDVGWFDDPVLRAAAEIEPAALVVWPILVATAKAESHADRNPAGVVETTAGSLASAALVDRDRASRVLELLVEGELIEVETGRLGSLSIRLGRFGKWQTPRASQAERDERHRYGMPGARAGKKRPEVDGSATAPRRDLDATSIQDGRLETGESERVPTGTPVDSAARTRPRRTPAKTDDEHGVERDELRARLDAASRGLGDLVADLVDVLAAGNATGKVATSRAVRLLWRPIAEALEVYPPDAVAYGVQQALAAGGGTGAPNPNYVKKAAARYSSRSGSEATDTPRGEHHARDTRTTYTDPDGVF